MGNVVPIFQKDLLLTLNAIATKRPVFIWGQPGIGKSAIVEQFAAEQGLECVSLLGSQLSPTDIYGSPQLVDGRTQYCPPRIIMREKPFVLFLDELNGASQDVQKAFYSLIHDHQVGEYHLPDGTIIIGAGNRKWDAAIVNQMSSALINRMVQIHLEVSPNDWLEWAEEEEVHPSILKYIRKHPDQLSMPATDDEFPFSTPRAWHILSDVMYQWHESEVAVSIAAYGVLTYSHAQQFMEFLKGTN